MSPSSLSTRLLCSLWLTHCIWYNREPSECVSYSYHVLTLASLNGVLKTGPCLPGQCCK